MERRLAAIFAADMVGYSRLMEVDEDGVLARQKTYRKELIDPEIRRNRGRIVKTTGDGMLAEFSSAQDAVRCAIDVQTMMSNREEELGEDRRIRYRVGINLGDVVFDDDDIFGDGVNVAARLEGLAEPGGVCISDIVHQTVLDRLGEPFRDMGGQRVKNISRPIRVWQWTPGAQAERKAPEIALKQRVQFTASADGTQIAYASVGEGPAILKAPHWMNHIEYEWSNLVWGPFLNTFAQQNRLVRFDQRANGMSDPEPERIEHDAMLEDMEAVAEAAQLERCALFGMSQGASVAVRYAMKYPERVSALVIFGGYMRGRLNRGDPEQDVLAETGSMMIRQGWGSSSPVYRNFFTSTFIPGAAPEIAEGWDELQRLSTTPQSAAAIYDMNNWIDTVEAARKVRVPTLVLHIKGDQIVPIDEGRLTARLIPDAQFIELPGNHHVALEGEPCFDMFFEEVRAFLAEHT